MGVELVGETESHYVYTTGGWLFEWCKDTHGAKDVEAWEAWAKFCKENLLVSVE